MRREGVVTRRWLVLLGVLLSSDSCRHETFTWYRSSDDFVAVNLCERGWFGVSVSSKPLNWLMRYTRIATRFASMWALFSFFEILMNEISFPAARAKKT
jgi:hypothetical protein